jgi:hypothetical protein
MAAFGRHTADGMVLMDIIKVKTSLRKRRYCRRQLNEKIVQQRDRGMAHNLTELAKNALLSFARLVPFCFFEETRTTLSLSCAQNGSTSKRSHNKRKKFTELHFSEMISKVIWAPLF